MAGKRILEFVFTGNAKEVSETTEEITARFGAMAGAIHGFMFSAGAAVFDVVGEMVEKVATFAFDSAKIYQEQVGNASRVSRLTGASIEDASKLAFAASQSGMDIDMLAQGIGVFSKALDSGRVDDFASALGNEGAATIEAAEAHEKLIKAQDRLNVSQHSAQQAAERITDAQEAVSDASRRVADAQSHVGDVTQRISEANARYHDSLERIVDAQQHVQDAQNALNDALNGGEHGNDYELRKQAATLGQETATSALADAQERLRKATTPAEQERARLDVRRAELDVLRANNEALDAQAAQSDDVAVAQTALEKAQEGVADAQAQAEAAARGVTKAEEELGRASQAVTEAHKAQAKAVGNVTDAQWAYQQALKAVEEQEEIVEGLSDQAGKALKTMGIATRDANGNMLPAIEILGNVADHFEKMPNGLEKTRLSMQLFGRTAGPEFYKLLNKGRDGLQETMDKAKEYGLVFDQQDADRVAKAKETERKMSALWLGFQAAIGEHVLPILTRLQVWFVEKGPEALDKFTHWLDEHQKDIDEFADTIIDIFKWLEKNVPEIIGTVVEYWGYFQAGLDEIRPVIDLVTLAIEASWEQFNNTIIAVGYLIDALTWLKEHVVDPLVGSFQDLVGWMDKVKVTHGTGGEDNGWSLNDVAKFLLPGYGTLSGLGNASGTGSLGDGMFTTGEEGPELGYKSGSRVQIFSNPTSARMVAAQGSGGVQVHLHGAFAGSERELGRWVKSAIAEYERGGGRI